MLLSAAQLWSALNGQHQVELARELYTNATRQKIALLKYLQTKEESQAVLHRTQAQAMDDHVEVS